MSGEGVSADVEGVGEVLIPPSVAKTTAVLQLALAVQEVPEIQAAECLLEAHLQSRTPSTY